MISPTESDHTHKDLKSLTPFKIGAYGVETQAFGGEMRSPMRGSGIINMFQSKKQVWIICLIKIVSHLKYNR